MTRGCAPVVSTTGALLRVIGLQPRGLYVILPLAHTLYTHRKHMTYAATALYALHVTQGEDATRRHTHTYAIVCGGSRRPAPPTPCVRGCSRQGVPHNPRVCNAQQGQNGWGEGTLSA